MAEVPKRYFERFFVIGGLIFVVFLVWGAFWIQNAKKLQVLEGTLLSRFIEFNLYKKTIYFPDIKVLDSKGDFIDIIGDGSKFSIITIWKTSCKSCLAELMSLNRLNQILPYEMKWQIIAISIDDNKDLPKLARFVEHYKIGDIASYNDFNQEIHKKINVSNLPVTFILNESGRMLYGMRGGKIWHDQTIMDFLRLIEKVY